MRIDLIDYLEAGKLPEDTVLAENAKTIDIYFPSRAIALDLDRSTINGNVWELYFVKGRGPMVPYSREINVPEGVEKIVVGEYN